MKKKFPVFALGALMLFVVSCEKETDGIDNKEEQGTENADTFFVEAIDLGLSVKWAERNVGANKPEDYGSYYAWGETEEKEIYSEDTYLYFKNGSYEHIGSDISGTKYDVAYVKWGNGWRMPTMDEVHELCVECSFELATINDIVGVKVTGPNKNSIFLPSAGGRYGSELKYSVGSGWYWFGALVEGGNGSLAYLLANETMSYYEAERWIGLPIRPVKD